MPSTEMTKEKTKPRSARPSKRPLVRRWTLLVGIGSLAGALGWYGLGGAGEVEEVPASSTAAATPSGGADEPPLVEVVRPEIGGIERATIQPGSVHSFETVDLYAMVSGYLKSQSVDIGSRVKKGQLLAEIDVPREREAVDEAAALLDQAKAQARQAAAKVEASEAGRETAAASVAQVEADLARLVADRQLAEKSFARISEIAARNAVERRLVDEERHRLDSAIAAEKAGRMAIRTAKAKLLTAAAVVEQARADVAHAEASVGVAESRLDRARVDLDYARIVAPFDGVITRRNFHPGAYISSSASGSREPLLRVERTDLLRVVIRVPDRDVALTDPGDPVELTIDALGDRTFAGAVSRVGESEDPMTRTMRVEVDLPNPDDQLREGMYGRARIVLEPASERLTLPTACVLDRSGKDQGVVRTIREGKVERSRVVLGADDGKRVEVVSGVGSEDAVVIRSGTPLEEGMVVTTKPAT